MRSKNLEVMGLNNFFPPTEDYPDLQSVWSMRNWSPTCLVNDFWCFDIILCQSDYPNFSCQFRKSYQSIRNSEWYFRVNISPISSKNSTQKNFKKFSHTQLSWLHLIVHPASRLIFKSQGSRVLKILSVEKTVTRILA